MKATNENAPAYEARGAVQTILAEGQHEQTNTAPDLSAAQRFLTALDEDADGFTFQTFDDDKGRRGGVLARILHGTLAENAGALTGLNERGAGVFVTVNATDLKGRKAENITRICAVWQEDDGGGRALPLEPHLIVESSPGKFHRYLFIAGLTAEQHAQVMAQMVANYGSDPNAADLSRVLRLPGFMHMKCNAAEGITPSRWLVRIIHESGAQPYSASEVVAAFKAEAARQKPEASPSLGNVSPRAHVSSQQVAELRAALAHMRADDRDLWIAMGQALCGLGEVGRGLWVYWSQTSLTWQPQDAQTWDTFKGDRTSYAAVFAEAQRQGWRNPASKEERHSDWPAPEPLAEKMAHAPYPLDALPDAIRLAVEEVAGFVKAPVAMVASSALGALSLTCQAHADVQRAEKLHGPSGVFLLTIADSGERKSTCDGFFTTPILEYEKAQAEASKPALKDYRAKLSSWTAVHEGVLAKIRELSKSGKHTTEKEKELRALEDDIPAPPKVPRLLYADATPEALAYSLAKKWPSGGVVSAEAGIVFGSHGMGKDSVMRNLGLLNQLCDGKPLTIDRKSSESFTVNGVRLTVYLQVQKPTLREFFAKSGALARGTGFLARFLVAWPESTQGTRAFSEAPKHWPHLARFHRRISAILDTPATLDAEGGLTPAMLPLTPEARAQWVGYHDAVESELASGGELHDVRDVASKSADNAARLAALFQSFEGLAGAINAASFNSASRIAAWHLHEARRFFGELALPPEMADAGRLDSWLTQHCRHQRDGLISTRDAQRLGPLRDKEKLRDALRELEGLSRVRTVDEGRRRTIEVNPALWRAP